VRNRRHSAKADWPSSPTLCGMVMFTSEVHCRNAVEGMAVRLLESVMEVRRVQPRKTPAPMKVTVFGSSMNGRKAHPLKA